MGTNGPPLRIGFIEPDLQRTDAKAVLIELANGLCTRGHDVTFYLPDHEVLNCTWMRCAAWIKTWSSGLSDPLDVLVFTHPPHWHLLPRFARARRRVLWASDWSRDDGRAGTWECVRVPVDLQIVDRDLTADEIEAEIGVRPVVVQGDGGGNRRTDELTALLEGVSTGSISAPPPPRRTPPDDPDLSIVVLAWDNLAYTQDFVESVRRHTDVPYELIIVDNGSHWEAANYAALAADVAVLNDRNLGFAAGMNCGLGVARGRHVAFCNNDTVLPEAWAGRLVATAEAHPRAGIVVPALTAAGTPGTVRTEPGDQIVVLPPFSGPPPAVIYLMPRNVVEGIEGWGEEYLVASGEDVDIGFKVWVNDLDIVFDERVLVAHVGKASASKLDDWQARWDENRYQFLAKWSGDTEVPRLASCDEQTFARNRAIATSAAEWMTKYFVARDKPPKVTTVVELSSFQQRLAQVRSGLRDALAGR